MNYNDFFALAENKGINRIQVTETYIKKNEIQFIDKNLEKYNISEHLDYYIKAERNNKTEKVRTDYLDESIIDLLIMKLDETDSNYEDDYLKKKKTMKLQEPDENDSSEELEKLSRIYKLKKISDKILKIESFYEEYSERIRIINNLGTDISSNKKIYYFASEVIIDENGVPSTYDKSIIKTEKGIINFEQFTKNVISEGLIISKKEDIETKKYNILLSKNVAGNIMAHMIEMLSATNIRLKTSCMENKINKTIFSNKISIIEEPTNKLYPGYRLFDDEGTETKEKYIIKNGNLLTYLSNIKEAKLQNKESTGNGYSQISARNMHIIEGTISHDKLLKELNDGLYITDYMGASATAISQTTGNISLQIFGFIVENGKIKCGFTPSIMTTNIFELFSNIQEIGNEIDFTRLSSASPELLIKNISIAGKKK